MYVFIILLPNGTVDPWKLFNPKKMVTIVFALTLIQYLGVVLHQLLGTRVGAILTGFFGGLVSSTATIATLAKKTKLDPNQKTSDLLILSFLSATTAMLMEGVAIVLFGTSQVDHSILIVFLIPIMVSLLLIYFKARKIPHRNIEPEENHFNLLPILKLSVLIFIILILSKVLQNIAGESGLIALTFIVSLFEIHGSFIANIQLQDFGSLEPLMLGNLIATSILASFCSKLFLIFTLGSKSFKKLATKYSLILFASLILSWFLYRWEVLN